MDRREGLGPLPEAQAPAPVPDISHLRVVGAGLPRTGTKSLQTALERLLDGRCYHMQEVFAHPDHVPFWVRANRGDAVDWSQVLGGYVAAVDWPASAYWRELSSAYPSAVVVLSLRDSADEWWESANATVLETARRGWRPGHRDAEWHEMFQELLDQHFTPDWNNREAAMAAYERHNAAVREGLRGSGRLVEWRPEDGWQLLCAGLGLAVPEDRFPLTNTREEWLARRAERQVAARHAD